MTRLENHSQATSKGSDETVCMRRLIWVFAGRTNHIVGNLMSRRDDARGSWRLAEVVTRRDVML